jgi:hypothetical protein
MEERGGGQGEGLRAGGAEAARQGARHDAWEARRPAVAAQQGAGWTRARAGPASCASVVPRGRAPHPGQGCGERGATPS